ncbi:MAG: hypothetical protein ACKVQK_28350 [Burkholderiales bacterium]
MPDRTWVVNASTLILLGKVERLDLLEALAPRLVVPQAVIDEIAAGANDANAKAVIEWARSKAKPGIKVPGSILGWDLGAGESQVLANGFPQRNELKKRATLLALLALGASPLLARAQATGKVWRIGYLAAVAGPDSQVDALREALAKLGYVEGRNVAYEYRWGAGREGRMLELGEELAKLKVDVTSPEPALPLLPPSVQPAPSPLSWQPSPTPSAQALSPASRAPAAMSQGCR